METPRYRLTQKAYIDEQLMEEGREVSTHLRPGRHMEPLNDSAREAVERAKHRFMIDPLGSLIQTPPVEETLARLARALTPQRDVAPAAYIPPQPKRGPGRPAKVAQGDGQGPVPD